MEVKEKIMREFLMQLDEKDFKEVKVDQIANNLGISKRTLYENFSNKEDLIEQTMQHYQNMAYRMIEDNERYLSNSLERVLYCFFLTIDTLRHINTTRLEALRKYYPEVSSKLVHTHSEFVKNVMLKNIADAQQDNFLCGDFESELVFSLITMNRYHIDKNTSIKLFGKQYDGLFILGFGVMSTIRGLCTQKGLEYIHKMMNKENDIEHHDPYVAQAKERLNQYIEKYIIKTK